MHEEAESEPEIIRAEVVEVLPGTPREREEASTERPRRRWRLAVLLFIATCLTTLWAGAELDDPRNDWWQGLLTGLWYAVPVMTILLCHEMGHFLQAYRYGVFAEPPFFIPMPLSPFGTFGAVILMEPRVGGRRALFDIGISGPLAGLIPTIIFVVIGLHQAKLGVIHPHGHQYGDPLLLQLLAYHIFGPIPKEMDVVLTPMLFAGWVGLFITSLNLIPIGQLDGGHVLYALLRKKAHKVASFLLFAAVFLVIWQYKILWQWTVMLFLLLLMGPIHPPTANDEEPLGISRTILGWLTLAFIVVGFTPMPLVR